MRKYAFFAFCHFGLFASLNFEENCEDWAVCNMLFCLSREEKGDDAAKIDLKKPEDVRVHSAL